MRVVRARQPIEAERLLDASERAGHSSTARIKPLQSWAIACDNSTSFAARSSAPENVMRSSPGVSRMAAGRSSKRHRVAIRAGSGPVLRRRGTLAATSRSVLRRQEFASPLCGGHPGFCFWVGFCSVPLPRPAAVCGVPRRQRPFDHRHRSKIGRFVRQPDASPFSDPDLNSAYFYFNVSAPKFP